MRDVSPDNKRKVFKEGLFTFSLHTSVNPLENTAAVSLASSVGYLADSYTEVRMDKQDTTV